MVTDFPAKGSGLESCEISALQGTKPWCWHHTWGLSS